MELHSSPFTGNSDFLVINGCVCLLRKKERKNTWNIVEFGKSNGMGRAKTSSK